MKFTKWKIPGTAFLSAGRAKAGSAIDRIKEKSRRNVQNEEMRDLSAKLRLHQMRVRLKYIIIGSVILLLLAGLTIYNYVRVFHHYSVINSVERSDDAVTEYVRVKKGRTLKCNPNGVTCVNDNDEVQWNTTFNMQSLLVDSCGATVVVGDQRGSDVYVFNDKGLLGNFEVEYTLVKVRVASQGTVAAVLEDGETTWVNMYDTQGNLLVTNKTSMGEMGYPLDVAISSDGQKLMVSYLCTDKNDVKSRVAFYNFSSVGQAQLDYLVNSVEYEGHIVPEVKFLGSKYAVAFRDDGLTFFSGRQVPEEKSTIEIDQEIISAFCDDASVGIVTASDDEKGQYKYKLQLYRSNGSKSMTKYFNMEYSDIKVSDEEIIIYNSSTIEIYTISGKKKFSAQYEKQIVEVVQAAGSRKYRIVTLDSTDWIQLK